MGKCWGRFWWCVRRDKLRIYTEEWIKQGFIQKDTERMIFDASEPKLQIRMQDKWWKRDESFNHLIYECAKIAQGDYE